MKNRKFISVLLSFSLIFGTVLANAVSISFDEIEQIETISNEAESNISFEELKIEEKQEELTNTDSNIYFEEVDSSEATKELEEDFAELATFSAKANQEVQVSVTNKPVVDVMLASKETNMNLDNFEEDLRNAIRNLGVDDSLFNFVSVERMSTEFSQRGASAEEIDKTWQEIPNPNAFIVHGDYLCNIVWNYSNGYPIELLPTNSWQGFNQSYIYQETYNASSNELWCTMNLHYCDAASGIILNYNPNTDIAYVVTFNNAPSASYPSNMLRNTYLVKFKYLVASYED